MGIKPITQRIDSILLDRKRKYLHLPKNLIHNTIIYGIEKDTQYPIAYLVKPNNISIEDWQIIKDKLEINLLK